MMTWPSTTNCHPTRQPIARTVTRQPLDSPATADPATVLALVARVRLAERMMSSLRALEAYPYLHMIPVEIFHALREARQAYDALGEG